MTYQLYRMTFSQTHFGQGSLVEASPLFSSERLFSALFLEALKINKQEEWLQLAQDHQLHLSNGLYYQDEVYLPKPMGYPKNEDRPVLDDAVLQRQNTKQARKLNYLSCFDFDEYVQGDIELVQDLVEQETKLYRQAIYTRKGEDPYRIQVSAYAADLCVIGTSHPLMEELMTHLQYTGLGGKRSSGLGRFDLAIEALPQEFLNRLTTDSNKPVMLLNDALPVDDQLEEALKGSAYLLVRSGGYAYSKGQTPYRKQDLFKFKAGSTFEASFTGSVVDVAPEEFDHPVWNYACPLFFELEGS
ncbi:MAG: type III-A CRISPR-associated RAMP protein Csm4 [Facklamia hominis]